MKDTLVAFAVIKLRLQKTNTLNLAWIPISEGRLICATQSKVRAFISSLIFDLWKGLRCEELRSSLSNSPQQRVNRQNQLLA